MSSFTRVNRLHLGQPFGEAVPNLSLGELESFLKKAREQGAGSGAAVLLDQPHMGNYRNTPDLTVLWTEEISGE